MLERRLCKSCEGSCQNSTGMSFLPIPQFPDILGWIYHVQHEPEQLNEAEPVQLHAKRNQVQPSGGGGEGSWWRRIKDGECWKGVWSETSNICGCRLSLRSVLRSKAGRWCICREAAVGQPAVCNSPNSSSFLGQMIYPWSAPAFFPSSCEISAASGIRPAEHTALNMRGSHTSHRKCSSTCHTQV